MFKKNAALYGLLKNEKIEIDAMLFYIGNDKFNSKVDVKEWSMSQIIKHIYMAESQTLQAIKWRLENKNDFPATSFAAYCKVMYTILLFKLNIKMKAPSFVSPEEKYVDKNQLLEDWEKIRKEWRDFIFQMPPHLNGKAIYKHPLLGYLSLQLTLIFMINHLKRHRKQLEHLVNMNEHLV